LMNNQALANKLKEIMQNMPEKPKINKIPLEISYGSKEEEPKVKKSRKKKSS